MADRLIRHPARLRGASSSTVKPLTIFPVPTFLAVLFFALFLGGVFALTRLAFDAGGRFQRRALPLLAATLAAFIGWIFALRRVPPPYPVEKTRFYIPPSSK